MTLKRNTNEIIVGRGYYLQLFLYQQQLFIVKYIYILNQSRPPATEFNLKFILALNDETV